MHLRGALLVSWDVSLVPLDRSDAMFVVTPFLSLSLPRGGPSERLLYHPHSLGYTMRSFLAAKQRHCRESPLCRQQLSKVPGFRTADHASTLPKECSTQAEPAHSHPAKARSWFFWVSRCSCPPHQQPTLHPSSSHPALVPQGEAITDESQSRTLQVVVFDNRGIGKSSCPASLKLYSTTLMADDAVALMVRQSRANNQQET